MALEVPRIRMADAEERVRTARPDATRVRAIWAPASESDILVEVWTTCMRTGRPRADMVRP